jgi:hypothetical protein
MVRTGVFHTSNRGSTPLCPTIEREIVLKKPSSKENKRKVNKMISLRKQLDRLFLIKKNSIDSYERSGSWIMNLIASYNLVLLDTSKVNSKSLNCLDYHIDAESVEVVGNKIHIIASLDKDRWEA